MSSHFAVLFHFSYVYPAQCDVFISLAVPAKQFVRWLTWLMLHKLWKFSLSFILKQNKIGKLSCQADQLPSLFFRWWSRVRIWSMEGKAGIPAKPLWSWCHSNQEPHSWSHKVNAAAGNFILDVFFLEMMHRGIYWPFRCVQLIQPRHIFRAKKTPEKPAVLWAGNLLTALPLQRLSVPSTALSSRGGWRWWRDSTDLWRGLIFLCLAINSRLPSLFRHSTAFTAGKEIICSLGFPVEAGVSWLLESRPVSPIMKLISHLWALGCLGIKESLNSWYILRKEMEKKKHICKEQ